MALKTVRIEKPEEINFILGQSHFIKTVEDLYEVMVTTVPQAKFGLAFNEASGVRLVRADGNDQELTKAAIDAALLHDAVERQYDPGGCRQGAAAVGRRRRAGMGFAALHRHLVPAHGLHAGHNTDALFLVLQDRPLLDMAFEIGADGRAAERRFALGADAFQGGGHVAQIEQPALVARFTLGFLDQVLDVGGTASLPSRT